MLKTQSANKICKVRIGSHLYASVAQSAARQSHNESTRKSDLKVVSSSLTRGRFFAHFWEDFTNFLNKKYSLEPDSNQRPKDVWFCHYSPPLYQLSYQGMMLGSEKYLNQILMRQNKFLKKM